MRKYLLKGVLCFLCLLSMEGVSQEKEYVSCKFAGELGNQMFEVATVLAYALDHQCEPVFPFFEAAWGDIHFRHVFYRLNALCPNHGIHFEDYYPLTGHYKYGPIPYEPGRNLRILGHYQNERFFAHRKDYIRQMFAPSEEVLQYITRKYGSLEDIFSTPVVGVHIRTFIPSARHPSKDGFGGATWQYFIDAINYFPENYTFLVFSDEPDWVEKNFPPCHRNLKFIKENPHYIDLHFLSLCHHQVVSPESTFSWWAAWLNSNSDKIVIVPHFWQQGITGEDAFPSDWVKIYAENKFGY